MFTGNYEALTTDPGRIAVALDYYIERVTWPARDGERAEFVRLRDEHERRALAEIAKA